MEEPKLYIIATPLGNRSDITLRALDLLKSLPIFFAEDSRECLKLFQLYEISHAGKVIHSYAKHNMKAATDKAIGLLSEGNSVGLLTDRGTPVISDPGYLMVREARARGIAVIPVPGASSVTAALSVSGLPADKFVFLGFLPDTKKERDALWAAVSALGQTFCFFESAKRVQKTAAELKGVFGSSRIFFAREMTKLFESYDLTDLSELDPGHLVEKGEYVVVVEPEKAKASPEQWKAQVEERLLPDKAWAKQAAVRCGVSASTLYNELQKLKQKS